MANARSPDSLAAVTVTSGMQEIWRCHVAVALPST